MTRKPTGYVCAIVLAVAVAAVGAGAASASGPAHEYLTFGPFVNEVAAGTICDFPYHHEWAFNVNRKLFFDDAGVPVRRENEVERFDLFRNVVTGKTLTGTFHLASHTDFTSGVARITGQQWALRDESGRLVVLGAGFYTFDWYTGEFLASSPNAAADFAAAICPALGAAPA